MSRLLVAARPRDLAVAPYDAFVNRRHRILEILSRHYQLRLVLLRADTDKFAIREDYEDLVVGYTRLAGPPDSRLLRLAAAGRVGVTSWAADGVSISWASGGSSPNILATTPSGATRPWTSCWRRGR